MSQAKVDQYKKEKANRKKTMAKEKLKRRIWAVVGGLVALAIVAWAGMSGYNYYESTRPSQNFVVDADALSDYLGDLD
jgi:hypothetical protein